MLSWLIHVSDCFIKVSRLELRRQPPEKIRYAGDCVGYDTVAPWCTAGYTTRVSRTMTSTDVALFLLLVDQ